MRVRCAGCGTRRGFLALAMLAPVIRLSAETQEPPPPSTQERSLQGVWEGKLGLNQDVPVELHFRPEGEFWLVFPPSRDVGLRRIQGRYRISSDHQPAQMDWTALEYKGFRLKDNLLIYDLSADGERLRLVSGTPDGRRPEQFPPRSSDSVRILEFRKLGSLSPPGERQSP